MNTKPCAQCGANLKPYFLKDGVCNACRNPQSVVTAVTAKHTPEPWRLEASLVDGRNRYSLSAGPNNPLLKEYRPVASFASGADAARALACVNALDGVANPTALGALFDALYALAQREPGVMEVHGVTKALAALKGEGK